MRPGVLEVGVVSAMVVVLLLSEMAIAPAGTWGRSASDGLAVDRSTSTNWAGYAVTGPTDSVTHVAGSWVEPKVKGPCSGTDTYASFWVGIDGYSSTTVEQIGTDSDCSAGSPQYYAWYEFYPANSVNIAMTIHPGNKISASVAFSGGTFTLKISDDTLGTTFTKTGKVASAQRDSAEWIVETPEICSPSCRLAQLTDFGTIHWTSDVATVSGVAGAIGNFSAVHKIILVKSSNHSVHLASTSALSSNLSDFTVKWKNAGP